MKKIILNGRKSRGGIVKGKALVSRKPLNFLGAVEIKTGTVIEKGHDLEGESLKDRIVVIPTTKGSTAGIYTIYELKKENRHPKAILCDDTTPILICGTAVSGILLMDKIPDLSIIETGDQIEVNAEEGTVTIWKNE